MMRKPNGNLHYFINGLDQDVAAEKVPVMVWGVVDLYGKISDYVFCNRKKTVISIVIVYTNI